MDACRTAIEEREKNGKSLKEQSREMNLLEEIECIKGCF